jgi:hypothetical protein
VLAVKVRAFELFGRLNSLSHFTLSSLLQTSSSNFFSNKKLCSWIKID